MPKPATPQTNIQWGAINQGAKGNTLVSQLFAGKPAPVIAAASSLPSQNAPKVQPQSTFPSTTPGVIQSSGTTPLGGIIQPPKAPVAPTNQTVTSHTVNSDGTVKQTYAPPVSTDPKVAPGGTSSPQEAPRPSNSGLIQGAITASQGNGPVNPAAEAATRRVEDIQKNIGDIRQQAGVLQGKYKGGGLLLPTGSGLAQQAAQTEAAQETGLGIEQQAAQQALTNTLASQQQQVGAQEAGITASLPGNQFLQVPFNQQLVGADGQPIGGGTGSGALQSAVLNAINLIKSGSGYSNAIAAANLGQFGPQGTTALLNALGPKFNVNASDADAAAVAQNINTGATTVTNTASSGYQKAYQDYQDLNQNYSGAQNLGSLLAQTMQKGAINSNGSIDYNQAANTLQAHLSSPEYAQFVSTLTNTANQYQNILTNSGATTPTAADSALLKILNPNSSMSAIIASLNQLNQEVYTGKVVPSLQKSNDYLKTL